MGYRESQKFKPIKIFDDFFNDPDKIREIALTCDYKGCDDHAIQGSWPGIRSDYLHNIIECEVFEEFKFKMFDLIYPGKLIKSHYVESYFQLCLEGDGDSWVHTDNYQQSDNIAIIYLSPKPQKNSGTIIYEPVECGFNAYDITEQNNYKEVEVIENVYNRLTTFDPMEFHKSDKYFGSVDPEKSAYNNAINCRLTIVVFFKVEFE
jgi:hypothetical protein